MLPSVNSTPRMVWLEVSATKRITSQSVIRDRKALGRDGSKAIIVVGTIAAFDAVQSSVGKSVQGVWYLMQIYGNRRPMVSQEKPGTGHVSFPSTRQGKRREA